MAKITTNLYRTSTSMYGVAMIDVGAIDDWSDGGSNPGHGISGLSSSMNVNRWRTGAAEPVGTQVNKIDFSGAVPVSLYASSGLDSGFTMSRLSTSQTITNGYVEFGLIRSSGTNIGGFFVGYGSYWSYVNNVYLARASLNGNTLAGFYIVNEDPNGEAAACFVTNTDWSEEFLEEASITVGRKGFRPTEIITRNSRGGGDGTGQPPAYYNGSVPMPGEPDETKASAIGAGFIHAYDITEQMLVNLGKVLFNPDYLAGIANIFINPLDGVISLNVFPYIPHIGSSEYVKILKYDCKSQYFGVDVTALPLTKQFRTVSFGTLQIPEVWQSFLDYDCTSASLYLPFVGEVSLDISEIMGGSITVNYTIDFFTGMCVANVRCLRSVDAGNGLETSEVVHSYQGNCAVQIPITAADYGNMVGALVSAASAGLTTGIAGAIGSVAGSAASGGFKPTITSKGTISANAGFCGVLYPYITLTRPITVEPDSYQTVEGHPSYIYGRLDDYVDLCVCEDIILTGLTGATDSEIQRIKQLCREGVYV